MAEPGLAIQGEPSLGKLMLRARDDVAIRAGDALGLALPQAVNRATGETGRRALRLGPDEYLLLLDEADVAAALTRLRQALADSHHAALDLSARFAAMRVGGAHCRDTLAAACPLDLHPQSFGAGQASRTLFGKAEVILDCRAESTFLLLVNRSFAPYARALLAEAGREFGLERAS